MRLRWSPVPYPQRWGAFLLRRRDEAGAFNDRHADRRSRDLHPAHPVSSKPPLRPDVQPLATRGAKTTILRAALYRGWHATRIICSSPIERLTHRASGLTFESVALDR